MTSENKQRPVARIKLSPLTATIWANPTDHRIRYYSIDIQRTFKDAKTGDYRYTSSLRPRDLATASSLLRMVESHLNSLGASIDATAKTEAA